MELWSSEIVFFTSDETAVEFIEEEEAKVNVEDVSTCDEDGGLMETGELRLVFTSAKDDDDDCTWTKSGNSLLATSIANEVVDGEAVMVDDEAEVMVDDDVGAGGRDSTARPHEILCISEDDDGGGGMIPDSMEACRDKVEEKSGEDVGADLSTTIHSRFAEFQSYNSNLSP